MTGKEEAHPMLPPSVLSPAIVFGVANLLPTYNLIEVRQ